MADFVFSPGFVTTTPAALALMQRLHVDFVELVDRHITGDHGEADGLAQLANRETLDEGVGTILSVYDVGEGEKIWVATTIPQDETRYTVLMLAEDW